MPFKAGERVFWCSRGLCRLGTVEDAPPRSLKARVRPAKGDPEELPVRRLYSAPPDLDAASARGFLRRDHDTEPAEISVDHATREASFVASDGGVDRFGDVIDPAGWDLKAFRRNPIFLWQHNTSAPIGTVPLVRVKDDRLVARARWIEPGISSLADQLFRLVEAGALCAISIGARSLADPEPIRDKQDQITGFRYGSMELLELSLVSVPANPNALLVGRSIGLEDGFLREAFESDASVANLGAYFDRLRAQVPGLLAPRPAKRPELHRSDHEEDLRPGCRARQAARREGDRARGAAQQGGGREQSTERQ